MLFRVAAATSKSEPVRMVDGASNRPLLRAALELQGAEVQMPGERGKADFSGPLHLVYTDTAQLANRPDEVSQLLAAALHATPVLPAIVLIEWGPAHTAEWAEQTLTLIPLEIATQLNERFEPPQAWLLTEVADPSESAAPLARHTDGRSRGVGIVQWSVVRADPGSTRRKTLLASTAASVWGRSEDNGPGELHAATTLPSDVSGLLEEAAMLREELDRDLFRLARRLRGAVARVPFGIPLARGAYHGAKRARLLLRGRQSHGPTVPLDPPGTAYPLRDRWLDFEAPDLSIVILNYNRGDLTLAALQHVWQNSAGSRYEVTVVDNGSTPRDLRAARQFRPYFRETHLSVNRFFGEGNNLGAEDAKGNYLIFLNNDALPQPGWLEPLMAAMRTPHVGAAGSRLLFADGRIQETGAMIHADGMPVQLEKGWPYERGTKGQLRAVDYCSAAALGMSKELFIRVGGFDLTWEPAYYEDVDLCLKIRSLGLEVVCATESHVVHLEHATTAGVRRDLDLRGQPEFNRRKFVARWGAALHAEGGLRATTPALETTARRRLARPTRSEVRVGLYTPYQLVPGGGERYLLMLASAAAKRGEVTLLFPERYSELRVRQLGHELNVALPENFQVGTYSAASRGPKFDTFISMGNEVFPPVAGLGQRNVYVCQFPFPTRRAALKARAVFDAGYHTVFVYSHFAAQAYSAARTHAHASESAPIVVYPPCGEASGSAQVRPRDGTFRILSVGRFFQGGHEKRHDVMIRALGKLLGQSQDGQKCELHLVGTAMQQWGSRGYLAWLERLARGLPVHFHVNASAEELSSLLDESQVYWHAAGFGVDEARHPEKLEHFGISIVEAMARGCVPIVYGAGGPKEIVTPGIDGMLYRSEAALVRETRTVLQWSVAGSDKLSMMASRAAERAAGFTDEIFYEQVTAVLAEGSEL